MGYNKEAGRVALQMCNNIISDSVQYIVDNPAAGPSQSASTEFNALIDDLVSQVIVFIDSIWLNSKPAAVFYS